LAQSEDYALLIKALLDLDQATLGLGVDASTSWLEAAVQLQAEFDEFLWSEAQGGYYNTDARADLVVRERSYEDNAIPSANGVAVANLVRLFLRTENLDYFERTEQCLQAFSSIMPQSPQSCPSLFAALDWFLQPTLVRTNAALLATLSRQYLPTVMTRLDANLPVNAVALVCEGLSCREPASSVEQLQTRLTSN
jgi:uncharacterized protein YyaL (SSP411 family)